MQNRKQTFLVFLGVAALLMGCGAGKEAPVPETTVPAAFDLTGQNMTVEEYRSFCQEHPDAQIEWDIPFQGERYSMETTALTVTGLTAEDVQLLTLFPNLTHIDATGCKDLETILLLKETLPRCRVDYRVTLGGTDYPSDAAELSLEDVSARELAQVLPLLNQVEKVTLTGLSKEEAKELILQFPEVFFLCQVEIGGQQYSTDSRELDLSGTPLTAREAEELPVLFPKLEKLILCDCGLDNETLDALNRSHPQIRIVWSLIIGKIKMRTDDTVFYPSKMGENNLPSNEELKKLRYCTDVVALDIGHSEATECEWLAHMPHVKYLILADTQISDLTPLENLKELVYLEIFSLPITDYSPLLGCTALQDVNISSTHADPEPLSRMTWLHNLQWFEGADDPDTREAVLRLEQQLPDTNVVIDTFRNVGGLWRYLPHYYVFRDYIGGNFYNQDYITQYWGSKDATKIYACDGKPRFAGELMAELVKERMEQGLPIPGIKNVGSEKEEILYQSLLSLQP